MPNHLLVLALCAPDSLLRRYTVDNPVKVPYHHRESMLDELDLLIAKQRRLGNKDNVHALLDTAHWVSTWPLNESVVAYSNFISPYPL